MSKIKASRFAQLQRARTIVRLERATHEEGHVRGRIVASSAKLVAVATISDAIHPDGISVFRRADISKLTAPDPYADFVTKALRLRREVLSRARLDLTSWRSLVTGARRRFPFITVHTEQRDPDVCYIGVPVQMTARALTLVTIGPDAAWHHDRPRTFAWSDVTQIGFGGEYENALALVARPR